MNNFDYSVFMVMVSITPFVLLYSLYLMYKDDQQSVQSTNKTRPAKDLNGNELTWHLFYINQHQQPMALVEYSGTMRSVSATSIEFTDTKSPVT